MCIHIYIYICSKVLKMCRALRMVVPFALLVIHS